MNWDQIEGQWKQLKGDVKSKWAKLTDDDMTSLSGKKDDLVGRIQERYGILKEEAEGEVNSWIEKLSPQSQRSTTVREHPLGEKR